MNNPKAIGKGAPFFISTAIPYVNNAPHVGFAEELLLADVVARFQRLIGKDVWFLTGTDENSLKNVQAAEREGIPVQQLVDRNARVFADLRSVLNLTFDDFIRTSVDERHAAGVRRIWEACEKCGDLYKKNYKGLYCVGCEQFYTESELEDGLCKDHLTRPEEVEEENYFFRLTRYRDQILELLESDKLEILPRSRKAEIVNFVRNGLEDFSVSRSKKRAHGWGLPVPGDEDQVIYVWFDALVNYISALDFAKDSAQYQRFWASSPDRVHAIGKGITRFHALYWPAILLSAGLPLPTKLFVHGYLTVEGKKIGKSLGNVIAPEFLVDTYGLDTVRYFLLRDFPADRDADFTTARLVAKHNTDLVSKLGNLLNRSVAMIARYNDGLVPEAGSPSDADSQFVQLVSTLPARVEKSLAAYELHEGLNATFDVVDAANKYIQDQQPWTLAKARTAGGAEAAAANERLHTVLYNLAESLRIIAYCLAAFLPATADKIAGQLGGNIEQGEFASQIVWGVGKAGTRVQADALLFEKLPEA